MLAMGLRHFRVELLREDAAQATSLLDQYARVLAGDDAGRVAWHSCRC